MKNASGNKYYYVFEIDSNADIGDYKFVVWAEDANTNIDKSAEKSFTVTPLTTEPSGQNFLNDWWWLLLLIVIIIVVLVVVLLPVRKGKKPEATHPPSEAHGTPSTEPSAPPPPPPPME
jgi:hypothetical protein